MESIPPTGIDGNVLRGGGLDDAIVVDVIASGASVTVG